MRGGKVSVTIVNQHTSRQLRKTYLHAHRGTSQEAGGKFIVFLCVCVCLCVLVKEIKWCIRRSNVRAMPVKDGDVSP